MTVCRTRVKICGVTRPADARLAADLGADAIGLILHARSPRTIDLPRAREVVAAAGGLVARVGVFVDAPFELIAVAARVLRLTHVQLHGSETAADLCRVLSLGVRAIRAVTPVTADGWLDQDTLLLLDTPREADHRQNDWEAIAPLLDRVDRGRVMVAGGLTPQTVGPIIERLGPYAVDVSSGVEAAEVGVKSESKLTEFFEAVRGTCGPLRTLP